MIILAIARNGFLESIRQPVFIVLVVVGIVMLVVATLLGMIGPLTA